jgi:hypothetical protein
MARAFEKGKITFTPEWHVGGHKTEKQPTAVFRTSSLKLRGERNRSVRGERQISKQKNLLGNFVSKAFYIGTFDQSNLSA